MLNRNLKSLITTELNERFTTISSNRMISRRAHGKVPKASHPRHMIGCGTIPKLNIHSWPRCRTATTAVEPPAPFPAPTPRPNPLPPINTPTPTGTHLWALYSGAVSSSNGDMYHWTGAEQGAGERGQRAVRCHWRSAWRCVGRGACVRAEDTGAVCRTQGGTLSVFGRPRKGWRCSAMLNPQPLLPEWKRYRMGRTESRACVARLSETDRRDESAQRAGESEKRESGCAVQFSADTDTHAAAGLVPCVISYMAEETTGVPCRWFYYCAWYWCVSIIYYWQMSWRCAVC